jgi:hypothetical protein
MNNCTLFGMGVGHRDPDLITLCPYRDYPRDYIIKGILERPMEMKQLSTEPRLCTSKAERNKYYCTVKGHNLRFLYRAFYH